MSTGNRTRSNTLTEPFLTQLDQLGNLTEEEKKQLDAWDHEKSELFIDYNAETAQENYCKAKKLYKRARLEYSLALQDRYHEDIVLMKKRRDHDIRGAKYMCVADETNSKIFDSGFINNARTNLNKLGNDIKSYEVKYGRKRTDFILCRKSYEQAKIELELAKREMLKFDIK